MERFISKSRLLYAQRDPMTTDKELSDIVASEAKKPSFLKKTSDFLKFHIVDTTSQLLASNPLYVAWEKLGLGFSDKLSIDSRIDASILFYSGAGLLFSKGRDLYYKAMHRAASKLHDAAYASLFGVLFSAAIYAKNGAPIDDVAAGALTGAALGAMVGTPVGYAIDAGRDLTGLKKSERLPEKVRNLPGLMKKSIYAGLLAASVALMAGIYYAVPDNFKGLKGYFAQCFSRESK